MTERETSYIVFVVEGDCCTAIEESLDSPYELLSYIVNNELHDANYDKHFDGLHSFSVEAVNKRMALIYGLAEAFKCEVPSEGSIWCVLTGNELRITNE